MKFSNPQFRSFISEAYRAASTNPFGLLDRLPRRNVELAPQDAVLPESLRFELAHLDGKLSRGGLLSLCALKGYENCAVYFIAKALAEDPRAQTDFLKNLASLPRRPAAPDASPELTEYLMQTARSLPQTTAVPGASKLALVARQGPQHWDTGFEKLFRERFAENAAIVPAFVAYAGLLGLLPALRAVPANSQILILFDPRTDRPHSLGYLLQLSKSDPVIDSIRENSDLRAGLKGRTIALVNDTYKTGRTCGAICDYFNQRRILPPISSAGHIFLNHAPRR